ncbi:Uncharacterized protein OBRU01_20284 [Operophtera brumata]|uniref:Uncharacterized protein n=1 Tax=Operophtera brumata TaxID=104452 RepID=A0A0L7KVJ9_OPEBR|nr:Uncharacterized protein OBRU01_20284 [Operophtera brumata]
MKYRHEPALSAITTWLQTHRHTGQFIYEDKPAVVNSIIVSLGLMKYRHEPALSAITTWLQTHRSVYL